MTNTDSLYIGHMIRSQVGGSPPRASHRQRPPRAFDKPGAVRRCPGRGRWEEAQERQNRSGKQSEVCFQIEWFGKVGRLSQLTAPSTASVCGSTLVGSCRLGASGSFTCGVAGALNT